MNLLVAVVVALSTVACKEKGCTDPYAYNYNPDAEKEDESCGYNGRAVCWFNSVTATNCVNASIPNIDFYVDNVKAGTVSMADFSTGEPLCGGADGITATLDIGSGASVTKSYAIKEGGTSNVLQSGTVLISKDVCHWIEFTY